MAEPADLALPWTRARAASRLRELLIGEFGPETEREPETEYAQLV
jgi:hypothetical protein